VKLVIQMYFMLAIYTLLAMIEGIFNYLHLFVGLD
jgi:hypothetical protein